MKCPKIQISWGELFDKITILQIKNENLTSQDAIKNVEWELKQLKTTLIKNFSHDVEVKHLQTELRKINKKLWDIEDRIRDKERTSSFDDEFIQLARSVYITNDERSRIKKRINETFGSELVEKKSYSDY